MSFDYEEAHNARLRGTFLGFIILGSLAMAYNIYDGVKSAREFKNKSLEREIEQTVINYVDKDSNGLSFSEDYKVKELMGVQDSAKNYELTAKDWERAYKKFN